MKRSGIKPGAKSLTRGTTFEHRGGALRRSPRKRTAPKPSTAIEAKLALTFHDEALRYSPRCENCGYVGPHLEAHHVTERRFIRAILRAAGRDVSQAALWDTRNAMTLCSDPAPNRCHDRHTDHFQRVAFERLRAAHFEFARELDGLVPGTPFSARLEQDYPPAIARAA